MILFRCCRGRLVHRARLVSSHVTAKYGHVTSRHGHVTAARHVSSGAVEALLARQQHGSEERLVTELQEECQTGSGLAAILDARDSCNTLIRQIPELRLLNLDKTLLAVLQETVTPETTVITKATKDSPGEILEVVRSCDRVHPIQTDEDLQARMGSNRSVFILSHRLLPSRPLVILHVAHSTGMFQCVSDIKEGRDRSSQDTVCRRGERAEEEGRGELVEDRGRVLSALDKLDDWDGVHTFYSISSLEVALRGIPCGGWCISKAKATLAPRSLATTLSPIPGLRNWLDVAVKRNTLPAIIGDHDAGEVASLLTMPSPPLPLSSNLAEPISRLAAYYLVREKQRGKVLDPVGHFHVTNGAAMWALRWAGNRSVEMRGQSLGLMVNYLYEPETSATRSELYAKDNSVTVGAIFRDLL